ncbi:universal stress protein [uncultured Marixanthomonas sp.]|uniref:universal stress protein n=1 Tax=uncultured Marixanthomonas sp. TaxID=757245 RepID=UPI0030DA9EC8|tara:strand:+ start:38825 stop:39661 length:837 start_codon:yes stop_codon:yes gene_type:complete
MNTILLPTDFSESSKDAIIYALEFFKGQTCTFYFLNIQKTSEYVTADVRSASPKSSVYDAVIADNKKELSSFVDTFKKDFSDEDYTFYEKVDYDAFVDAINQSISLYNIDLIIMGTNGATGAKEVLWGSNTLQVIRQVDHPVFVIPANYSYKKIDSILFSLHHRDVLKKEKLQPLFSLIENQNQPHIHVLDVDDDAIANPNPLESRNLQVSFKNKEHSFHSLTGIPTPIAINTFVQLFNISIHAMFVEQESFLERFIFGSEASKISYGTRIPLLVLHQ